MAKLLKLRRGTTAQHSSFTGAEGEVTIDTTKDTAVVHDGSQAGGRPLAREDMSNVSSASIAGRLGTGAIQGTQLENSGVTAGQYGSSSAIPIVTVDAQGLVTGASTTAIDSTTIANGTSNVAVANNGNITATRAGTARLVVDGAGVDVTGTLDVSGQTSITGGILNLGAADTASGHINSYEVMTFNIDTDNDDTNRYFQFNKNSASGSGTQLFKLEESGQATLNGNLYTASGVTVGAGHITLPDQSSGNGKIKFGAGNDLQLYHNGTDSFIENSTGSLYIRDTSGGDVRIQGKSGEDSIICHDDDGVHIYYDNSVKLTTESYGVNVTGNINVSGTVDGVDVATRDTLFGGLTSSSGVLSNGVTATTQGTSDNSTKVATTAYVTTAVANAEPFPSGTKMIFQQSSAPTGWTKVTSNVNNKALRLVSGNVSSGGNQAFTSAFASRTPAGNVGGTGNALGNVTVTTSNSTASFSGSVSGNTGNSGASTSNVSTGGNVNNHTLSNNQVPSHSHSFNIGNYDNYGDGDRIVRRNSNNAGNFGTNSSGGGGSHSHGFSGSSHSHNVNNHTHSFSANFSGNTGNHTHSINTNSMSHSHNSGGFSGTAMDFAVQYIDVIVCSKD